MTAAGDGARGVEQRIVPRGSGLGGAQGSPPAGDRFPWSR